jgi:hypothetical protein
MTLTTINERLDELLERIHECEKKKPGIHYEILRNYKRALYFGFISDSEFNKIKEDIEALEKLYEELEVP